VVFVHGLDGDARKSWTVSGSSFWPLWLAEDVAEVAVWSVGYAAWSSGWRGQVMPIQDRAINVLAQLQNNGIGDRPLCFVTHSMGGLLVKEMLLHAAEGRTEFAHFATATKGVVFLGTPHTGAGLAKVINALGVVYRGTSAVGDLKRNSAHLRQLNDRYRNWVDVVGIRNLVFFETLPTKGVHVVDEGSANPGLARVKPIPVDANHIDICKPADRTSVVYGQVRRFIAEIRTSELSDHDSADHDKPGLPICELDPFDLEVHPSIAVGPVECEIPALPKYIDRPHDVLLREVVQLAASGTSGIGVLVGSSSSGKTRACWEAAQGLPDPWRLWHPLSPGRPKAVLDGIDKVQPRTVIWLNELQHYLFTPSSEIGEEVAASLRELLRNSRRAPILVLGTIWPEYLDKIMRTPPPGGIDLHSQARALITNTEIVVPPAFSPTELEMARAAGDPRLAQALAQSRSGEVAQYLAGSPALLERYRTAPAAALAVINTAIDAQRLGYSADLSRSFLERAAPGYLSDSEWQATGDDWLDSALEFAGGMCRGAAGLLVRQRLRPGQGVEGQSHYRLADYISQWGRKSRCFDVPPTEFWEAGLEHIQTAQELISLGQAAAARWRIRYAAMLYQRAIELGEPAALLRMGELEERRGNTDRAEGSYLRAATDGNPLAQMELARLLSSKGNIADAKSWLNSAADQGEFRALQSLSQMAEAAGDKTEAANLMEKAAELAGHDRSGPLRQLARLCEEAGASNEAKTLREQAQNGVRTFTRRSLPEIQKRSGGASELERQIRQRISDDEAQGRTPSSHDLELLAEIFEDKGERQEAEALANAAAEGGNPSALLALAATRFNNGDSAAAERLARRAADAGTPEGLLELARISPEVDRLQRIRKFGLETDGRISPSQQKFRADRKL